MARSLIDLIRDACHRALCECVCETCLAVCLLTEDGERAALQPHIYR